MADISKSLAKSGHIGISSVGQEVQKIGQSQVNGNLIPGTSSWHFPAQIRIESWWKRVVLGNGGFVELL